MPLAQLTSSPTSPSSLYRYTWSETSKCRGSQKPLSWGHSPQGFCKWQITQPPNKLLVSDSDRESAIVPCALRLHYLSPNVLPTQQNLAVSLVVVCTQLQIGYGTMAVTFPCLRPFVSVYEADPITTKQNSYYQQGSQSDIKLTSVASTTNGKSRRPQNRSPSGAAQPTFRPDLSTHTATVSYNHKKKTGGDTSSVHSHDSQKMFIERTVDYTVTYDERSLREDRLSSTDGHA
jgi:hypothetical protein